MYKINYINKYYCLIIVTHIIHTLCLLLYIFFYRDYMIIYARNERVEKMKIWKKKGTRNALAG